MSRGTKILAFVAVTVAAAVTFAGSALGGQDGVVAAAPGEPTYSLGDVVASGPAMTDKVGTSVPVSFTTSWVGGSWPGYADCELRVQGPDGQTLGTQDFRYNNVQSDPATIQTNVHLGTDIAASTPTSVSGWCAKAQRPASSAGYTIGKAAVVDSAEGPKLAFQANWVNKEDPGYETCVATFKLADGSSADFSFGVSMGDGDTGQLPVPSEYSKGSLAGTSCRAYEGEGK
jgi:hypothetical protein